MIPAPLLSAVASATGIPASEILGRSHRWPVADARHVLAYALRERGWSYPRIGAALGRDHTTIMHAVDKVRWRAGLRAQADASITAAGRLLSSAAHDARSAA